MIDGLRWRTAMSMAMALALAVSCERGPEDPRVSNALVSVLKKISV